MFLPLFFVFVSFSRLLWLCQLFCGFKLILGFFPISLKDGLFAFLCVFLNFFPSLVIFQCADILSLGLTCYVLMVFQRLHFHVTNFLIIGMLLIFVY